MLSLILCGVYFVSQPVEFGFCVAVFPYSAGGVLQNDGQVKRNAMNTEPHLISGLIFILTAHLKSLALQNAIVCLFMQWFEAGLMLLHVDRYFEPLQLIKQQPSSA